MAERPYASKEAVRAWLKHELEMRRPPPDIAQIRRELGWDLVQQESNFAKRCAPSK